MSLSKMRMVGILIFKKYPMNNSATRRSRPAKGGKKAKGVTGMKSAILKKVIVNGITRFMFTCPVCGALETAMDCISDKAGECQSRDVVCKCTCGEIVSYNA